MKVKIKHNKKRNTAFLYEALVRELTKAVVTQDQPRAQKVKNIIREHFRTGSSLQRELACYTALLSEEGGYDQYTAEKLVFHAKKDYAAIGDADIFKEQSQIIRAVNQELGKGVYNNFVPNYKSFATLSQIFGEKSPLAHRVLMERKIMDRLTRTEVVADETLEPVDTLVVKSFVQNFNSHYQELLPEQKEMLGGFVNSIGPQGVDYRVYVGDELKRLHSAVSASLQMTEVKDDSQMVTSTKKVLTRLEKMNVAAVTQDDLLEILKIQKLAREYSDNGN